MQPSRLRWKFVEDRRERVYPTLASELDALRHGTKTISFFATDRAGLDEDLEEIRPAALARGLCVTIAPRGKVIDLFVHRANAAHRIEHIQKQLSRSPWSFAHEDTLGRLLGYTSTQRKAWLAAERRARPTFGVLTLYGSMVDAQGVPKRWWTESGRVPAPDAFAKREVDLQLWRVGVDPRYAQKLDNKGQIILASSRLQQTFDKAVRSPYERLGARGWKRVSTK